MPTTTAQDLLNQLMEEIAATDPDMLPPPHKKEPGDVHIGYVEDETIRKVFSLSSINRREAKRLQVDLESTGADAYDDATFSFYKKKHEALQELFWYLLRTHMEILDRGDVGIRQNWEVVEKKSESEQSQIGFLKIHMPPKLRKLLGLDD